MHRVMEVFHSVLSHSKEQLYNHSINCSLDYHQILGRCNDNHQVVCVQWFELFE